MAHGEPHAKDCIARSAGGPLSVPFPTPMRFLLLLLLAIITANAEPKVGPPNGSLLIHGGGKLGAETLNEFIRLAGGVDANFVIIPTAEPGEDWGEKYVARN